MQLTQLIQTLCDGDNNSFREIIYINKINDWYQQKTFAPKFEEKRAEYFKKYTKECKLANKRMSENKNKYGN